jgi:hypothetical protein
LACNKLTSVYVLVMENNWVVIAHVPKLHPWGAITNYSCNSWHHYLDLPDSCTQAVS